MKDKRYTIKNGDITLFVEKDYTGVNFSFVGFTVDGDSDKFYVEYASSCNKPNADGRQCIELRPFLFKLFKDMADEQLQNYVAEHIECYDFYAAYDHDRGLTFWNGVINSAGKEFDSDIREELYTQDVIDGIVGLIVNGIICKYSFINKSIVEFESKYGNMEASISLMKIFYERKVNQMLALEQYKRNKAPAAYTELAGLVKFLEGKHSLKQVLKSGAVHELKNSYNGDVQASDVLEVCAGKGVVNFVLKDNYHLKPRLGANLPLDALDCLQFGKQKHYLNVKRLKQYKNEVNEQYESLYVLS